MNLDLLYNLKFTLRPLTDFGKHSEFALHVKEPSYNRLIQSALHCKSAGLEEIIIYTEYPTKYSTLRALSLTH